MKRLLFFIFLFILIHQTGFSQQNPQSSLYFFNPLAFNPAYAGSRGSISVNLIHRSQWVGITGAPSTQFVSFHMPFRSQSIGVGLHIINDRIGARTSQSIFADFSYAIQLNKKEDRLAFGVTAGVDINQMNTNGLVVNDPTDPNFMTSYSGANPNFGFGLYYYGKRHYFGISIPRLLQMSLYNSATSNTSTIRHYYIAGGYVFKLNNVLDFKPSALIKFSENAPITFDINASFFLFQKFWIGTTYRFNESIGLNLTYQHKSLFYIGYAVDFTYNDLKTNSYGSHEVVLGFDFKRNKKALAVGPRYF